MIKKKIFIESRSVFIIIYCEKMSIKFESLTARFLDCLGNIKANGLIDNSLYKDCVNSVI